MSKAEHLRDRIALHSGAHLASITGPTKSTLDYYLVGRTVVIIIEYDDGGVDLYAPIPGNQLDDLEVAIDTLAQT